MLTQVNECGNKDAGIELTIGQLLNLTTQLTSLNLIAPQASISHAFSPTMDHQAQSQGVCQCESITCLPTQNFDQQEFMADKPIHNPHGQKPQNIMPENDVVGLQNGQNSIQKHNVGLQDDRLKICEFINSKVKENHPNFESSKFDAILLDTLQKFLTPAQGLNSSLVGVSQAQEKALNGSAKAGHTRIHVRNDQNFKGFEDSDDEVSKQMNISAEYFKRPATISIPGIKMVREDIYLKAVIRDLRKFFIEDFYECTGYIQARIKESFLDFKRCAITYQRSVFPDLPSKYDNDLRIIIAGFYFNKQYCSQVEDWEKEKIEEIQLLLKLFTKKKLAQVLKNRVFRLLFLTYLKRTGMGEKRLKCSKTFTQNPSMYFDMRDIILEMCQKVDKARLDRRIQP